jgi:hypothetical protein
MRPNLDSLTEEIQQYLTDEHFVVFRSMSRTGEDGQFVFWDTRRDPDFHHFLDTALQLGIRLVHFHSREFGHFHREDALEQLEQAELPRDEKRTLGRRLEELGIYEGFICAIELSFDFENRIYVFELQTEWYEEWHDILDEIEDASPGGSGGDSEPYGYYSNN